MSLFSGPQARRMLLKAVLSGILTLSAVADPFPGTSGLFGALGALGATHEPIFPPGFVTPVDLPSPGDEQAWPWHVLRAGPDGEQHLETDGRQRLPRVEELLVQGLEPALRSGQVDTVLIYAHGALVEEEVLLARAQRFREFYLPRGIYPILLRWDADFSPVFVNSAGGTVLGAAGLNGVSFVMGLAQSFGVLGTGVALGQFNSPLPDSVPSSLGNQVVEELARTPLTSKTWNQLKARAVALAEGPKSLGERLAVGLRRLRGQGQEFHLTLASHSTGALLVGHLAVKFAALGRLGEAESQSGIEREVPVDRCLLLAPACTVDFFLEYLVPLRRTEEIRDLAVFNLSERAEAEDTLGVYSKSLLTFVEEVAESPPAPILGLTSSFKKSPEIQTVVWAGDVQLVEAPNSDPVSSGLACRASRHVDFSTDEATLESLAHR